MDFLIWVVIGALAGFAARWVLPRDDADDTLVNVLLAIVGAVIVGYMVRTYNIGHPSSLYLVWATLGALVGAAGMVTAFGNMDNRSMTD